MKCGYLDGTFCGFSMPYKNLSPRYGILCIYNITIPIWWISQDFFARMALEVQGSSAGIPTPEAKKDEAPRLTIIPSVASGDIELNPQWMD